MRDIEQILTENLNEFVGFARKRLQDPELAADAVQESLLKALKAAPELKDNESSKAWIFKILRRTIIDLYRRKDVQERAFERLEREIETKGLADEEAIVCSCFKKLIPTLKPEYAELLSRIDLAGEALAPVAESLGISENNLKVRHHRARKQLKERLTETCTLCSKHGCLNCTCS